MKYNFYKTMLILSLFILCIVCTTTTANGQPWSGIRHFVIPNSPNIQGIDNKGDNTPDLWLTNFYLTGSIGKLHIGSQACSGATYSEWVPAYTGTPKTFDPFKIVSGTYKLKLPNGGPTGQLYQTLSAVSPWLPSKTITTILTSFSSIVSRAFFTMPTAKHIGMLMNGIGGSPSYFWIWDPTASGLSNPWDIQRSTIDDPSLWISNQSTQQAIYEFIPSTSVIRRWDISPIKLNVFYVNKIGKVNYVWVAGTDTLGNDCIGVLLSSGKYYYWKLTGGPRAMRSITFTGALTRTNTQCQVWLVNRYDPAVTILSPKSLFKGNADFVCDVAQGFENGSGVYFPGPELPSTPILVTQEQGDTTIMNVFSANHASPQTVIPKITTKKQFTTFSLTVDTIGALQRDYRIGDSCYAVGSLTRTLPCDVHSTYWNTTTGMNEVFSGAYLDIDMARTVNGSTAAATAIFWNEPARNAIGMFQNPVLPDIEPGTQIGEESEEQNATEFNLSQNYPNPFNPTTTFEFTLPKDASVTLTVYNTLGQLVAIVLDNKIMNEGKQSTMFDGRNLPTGVYYYHLRAVEVPKAGATAGVGNVLMDVKKMILMK